MSLYNLILSSLEKEKNSEELIDFFKSEVSRLEINPGTGEPEDCNICLYYRAIDYDKRKSDRRKTDAPIQDEKRDSERRKIVLENCSQKECKNAYCSIARIIDEVKKDFYYS